MAVLPQQAPFLMPNMLAQTAFGLGNQQRGIESARAAAIAEAREASLGRSSDNFRTGLANLPDILTVGGPEAAPAALFGGVGQTGFIPGALSSIHTQRAGEIAQANQFSEGFERTAKGTRDFNLAGSPLASPADVRLAIEGQTPGITTGIDEIQGSIASAAAGATKVRTPIAVARDKDGKVQGFDVSSNNLSRELSAQGIFRETYTTSIEFPDTTASGGQIGTSIPVSGAGGGSKPAPASNVDTPAGAEAQPEGTGGEPSVLNAGDPPERIAEDKAVAAQRQNIADVPLATVNTTPVVATDVAQVEATLRAHTVVTVQLDNGEEVTITPTGDGENVTVSGGGRKGKELIPIEEITRRLTQAQAGQ